MVIYKIDGKSFKEMIKYGYYNIKNNQQEINDLNVFPVPDGDTGTNMTLTIENGYLKSNDDSNIGSYAKSLARGMLLGARGNSGVILSQIFKGITNYLEHFDVVNAKEFNKALIEGYKTAYKAVIKPTEGTILTVARIGAENIKDEIKADTSINELLKLYISQMEITLAETPKMLKVLADAGVIDSGGKGLVTIFRGMYKYLSDEEIVVDLTDVKENKVSNEVAFNAYSKLEYGYCTEFILQLMHAKCDISKFDINDLIKFLETIGDSIVALCDNDIVKVHVHTMTPGLVINEAQKYGEFITFKLENMSIQHNEITMKEEHKEEPLSEYKIVAVGQGDGIIDLFKENRCDLVINGGQTMNPSTNDFVEAFDSLNAKNIIVFPNNKNIILSANQARDVYLKSNVIVIPTRSIAECFYALQMLGDPDMPLDVQLNSINEGYNNVDTISITKAIRDSAAYGPEIKEGEYIAFINDKFACSNASLEECTKEVLNKINYDEKSIAVAFKGNLVDDIDFVNDYICDNFDLECGIIDGQQDVYDIIIGIA